MLKETLTYTDFDGNEREEDFYFHLTEAEIVTMDISADGSGGMAKLIERLAKEEDGEKLMEIFRNLILTSYGEKSLDGKRFIKSKEISEAFAQTNAYNDLFVKLCTDTDYVAKFADGICSKVTPNGNKIDKLTLPKVEQQS